MSPSTVQRLQIVCMTSLHSTMVTSQRRSWSTSSAVVDRCSPKSRNRKSQTYREMFTHQSFILTGSTMFHVLQHPASITPCGESRRGHQWRKPTILRRLECVGSDSLRKAQTAKWIWWQLAMDYPAFIVQWLFLEVLSDARWSLPDLTRESRSPVFLSGG